MYSSLTKRTILWSVSKRIFFYNRPQYSEGEKLDDTSMIRSEVYIAIGRYRIGYFAESTKYTPGPITWYTSDRIMLVQRNREWVVIRDMSLRFLQDFSSPIK